MHDIVEPLKPDRASRHPVSRRALLEGSARAGLVAAAAGWGRRSRISSISCGTENLSCSLIAVEGKFRPNAILC
jgi:hypothetical protein